MEYGIFFAIVAAFSLGIFVNQRINRHHITSEECKAISKKHKDVLNWLKSGLADTKKVKMGKTNRSKQGSSSRVNNQKVREMSIRSAIDAIDAEIEVLRQEREGLQSQCKHKNTSEKDYAWRPGATHRAVICDDCDKYIRSVDNPISSSITSTPWVDGDGEN